MASGSIGDDSIDDLNLRGRIRWTPHSKVYTRRIRKKVQETVDNSGSSTATTSVPAATRNEVSQEPSADPTNPVSASPCRTEAGIPDASTVPVENPSYDDVPVPVPVAVDALVTAEDVNSSQRRVQEGGARQVTELQKLEDSPRPLSDATQNSKKSSPIHSTDELLKTNGNGALNLRVASPLSSENDLSNAREVETAELPVRNDLQGYGELVPLPTQVPSGNWTADGNGNVKPLVISTVEDRIRFHLSKATPKNEIEELRKRLECELDQVRRLVKELETKEIKISSFNTPISNSNIRNINNYDSSEIGSVGGFGNFQPPHARNNLVDRRVLLRVNSNISSIANLERRPVGLARMSSDVGAARNLEVRPYGRQLSVAVMENNQRPGEFVEKEKRTPKANQFYRKSEFLLAKDRLPPESNKRSKTNKGRKHRGESEYAFGFGFAKRAIKSCSSLLQRLMNHNHGWVFNEPVNAKALGLHDYHDIIKHPMDLGTIKTRLSQKWYKSPWEFAEDVRLVFRNAMTYNPKGQDVHVMAEQLSQIFEERWQILETEYNPYWKYQMYLDAGLPTPTLRKTAPQSHFAPASALGSAAAPFPALVPSYAPAPVAIPAPYAPDGHMRTLDRPDFIATPVAVDPIIQRPFIGRTPAPKKPKAKDPDKRDMTYDEKQKLSTNLQSLPAEKLDAIVQIIKRRSTALSQKDDEIEVDIDRVDTETLWELDRFVTNYKKSLSKYKRKAELAQQARMVAKQRLAQTDTAPASADVQIGNGADLNKSTAPLAAEGETKENSASRSSSSSSSSSDSGSSSSDSDSDSSSSDGSDEGNSPKP